MRILLLVALISVTSATWLNAAMIYTKAHVAHWLITASWEAGLAGRATRPWPWADMTSVARLQYADINLVVLSGTHGTALAFGPGHLDGTAIPGAVGTSVVAGHRDTHFRFLQGVSPGETIRVQASDGRWREFVVNVARVVDTSVNPELFIPAGGSLLVLVTCYPFDALAPGGPLRYVVEARPVQGPRDASSALNG